MNPQAYQELYAAEERHWWFLGRRFIFSEFITKLNLPNNARILEVGCGTGGNLKMLSRFGKVHGVEMDYQALALATNTMQGNVPIIQARYPAELAFEEMKFDLICLFDVLEHIDEDQKTLNLLRDQLTPNGYMMLAVPAHQWLFGAHDQLLQHKRRYTQDMLRQKINQAGLKIQFFSYFNFLLSPLVVIARLLERQFPPKKQTLGIAMPPTFLNSLLLAIFSLERWLLSIRPLPFGISILCIAKRV